MLLFFIMAKNFDHTKPWLIKDNFDREASNFFFECEPEHRVINAKKAKHEVLDYYMTQLGYHYFFDIAELHKWYQSEVLGKQRFLRKQAKNGRFGYLVPISTLYREFSRCDKYSCRRSLLVLSSKRR